MPDNKINSMYRFVTFLLYIYRLLYLLDSDELTTNYSYYNNQDYDHHHNFTHDGLDDETDENSNSHESYIESGRTSSSNDSTFASNPHNQQHQYDQYNNTNSYQYHYGNNV